MTGDRRTLTMLPRPRAAIPAPMMRLRCQAPRRLTVVMRSNSSARDRLDRHIGLKHAGRDDQRIDRADLVRQALDRRDIAHIDLEGPTIQPRRQRFGSGHVAVGDDDGPAALAHHLATGRADPVRAADDEGDCRARPSQARGADGSLNTALARATVPFGPVRIVSQKIMLRVRRRIRTRDSSQSPCIAARMKSIVSVTVGA